VDLTGSEIVRKAAQESRARHGGPVSYAVYGCCFRQRQSGLAQRWRPGKALNFRSTGGLMEMIGRQGYGFGNFENNRQRVQVLCA
jgi:hypothetical protein